MATAYQDEECMMRYWDEEDDEVYHGLVRLADPSELHPPTPTLNFL